MSSPSFTDLGVPLGIADRLADLGRPTPFAIQVDAIPDALAGRDVAGSAPTGSGKTLAFSVPVATRVTAADPHLPRALILTPTRELAAQIREVLQPLCRERGRTVATFYGGTNIKRDVQHLRRGVDVAVATPGRLEDLVDRGELSLSHVDLVVLDEADRMADMGFLPVVTKLLDKTPDHRQTLLFSATLDGDVDVLVRRYQRNPARHVVASDDADLGDVAHRFVDVTRESRRPTAVDLLRGAGPAIVFTRTKRGADRLATQLRKAGLSTAAIHGNRSQNQRERALERFTAGDVAVLVATDVAARGIHVDDVDLVVHFDLPSTDKDYVHRSGRTGRAGRDGAVVSLVLPDQRDDVRRLQRALDLDVDAAASETGRRNDSDRRPSSRRTTPRNGARPRSRRRRSHR